MDVSQQRKMASLDVLLFRRKRSNEVVDFFNRNLCVDRDELGHKMEQNRHRLVNHTTIFSGV